MRSPVLVLRVSGPSMVPTLRSGDLVLAITSRAQSAPIRSGQVVIARFEELPGLLVVKRAVRPVAGGWWVTSDNPFVDGDSRSHGAAQISARVVARIRWGRPMIARVAGVPPAA